MLPIYFSSKLEHFNMRLFMDWAIGTEPPRQPQVAIRGTAVSVGSIF